MNLSTIGGLFCALGVVMGPNESTATIQAEVVDGRPVVQASAPASTAAATAEIATEAASPVKTQHVVKFHEYEPKKRKRGLVEKLFKKLGHDTFEDDYAGTIIVEKMVAAPVQAQPQPAKPVQPVHSAGAMPPPVAAAAAVPATTATESLPAAVVTEPSEAKHGTDYKWIQGRLQRVHVRGGAWVVRYAPLDQADKHGGSVVLLRDHRLDTFKEGDFVHIDGEILQERSSAFLGGPLYRVHHIALLQAANDETNLK